ncbi:MAG: hypothetical protein B6244_02770 [Candidatus Cloacimonetes bacterium 4572_55]|nr:MAG: hypothetical protein B6244_02770 [Candidatus Cloacimonetes bacterium 4572_55]
MRTIIFYSPHFGESTLDFVRELRYLKNVHVIGLGQDPPDYIRSANARFHYFDDFYRVNQATDQAQLEQAISDIQNMGPIHRLLNIQEPLQLLIARIRERFGIPGLYPKSARLFRDKDAMKKAFRQNQILCAKSSKAEIPEQAIRFAEEQGYPIIIKPLKGAGSENTFFLSNREDLDRSIKTLQPSPDNPIQLEEFIEGDEGSFDTITISGKIYYHGITTYHPGPMEAMLNPWIQPIYMFNRDQDSDAFEDIHSVGRATLKAMDPGSSLNHTEWFRRKRDGKIYAAEIAARPPGHPIIPLHNYGCDMNLYYEWNNVMINDHFDTVFSRKYHVGCACLRAQGSGEYIRHIEGIDVVEKEVGKLIHEQSIPAIGTEKKTSYIGEGSLFCRGDAYQQVFDALQFIVNTVRIYC